jgi:hypothetical protein
LTPRIIGLAGRAGSGKSTCARFLVEKYGAREFSFAEPLKRLAQDVFGFTDAQVFGSQADKEAIDPRWGISPREALIRLGNSARERVDPYIWLNACLRLIHTSGAPLAVVSDVRYPNEASAIADEGHVFLLSCPDADTKVNPDAPSERSVDNIDPKHIFAKLDSPRTPGAWLLLHEFKLALDGLGLSQIAPTAAEGVSR